MIIEPNAKTMLWSHAGTLIDLTILTVGFKQVGPPADPSLTIVGDHLIGNIVVPNSQINERFLMILGVKEHGKAQLTLVTQALDSLGFLLGAAQGGEEHPC